MAYAVYTLRLAVHRHRPGRPLRGHARGERRPCLEIVAEQLADIAAGNVRADELERAKENLKGRMMLAMESTSNRMSRLGKSLITDTELLSIDRLIAEIEAVEADAVAELASVLLAPERISAAGIGPLRGAVPRRGRSVNPGLVTGAAAAA